MSKLQIPFIVFAVITTLGLTIGLQGVFGINIGSVLNLGGNKITNVGAPTAAGDVATKGFVDAIATRHIPGGLYGGCQDYFGVAAGTCVATSPAFCRSPSTPLLFDCECPLTYTTVVTGVSQNDTVAHASCYKN